MHESSPDLLALSAKILARLPRRVGASILGGLERVDRLTGRSGRMAGGTASRAVRHRAAWQCLFSSTEEPLDPQLSRRAVWRHVRWVCDSLAGFGGRSFHTDWEDATDLAEVAGRNDPLLIVTAHVGNWLVVAQACTDRLGPIETVAGVQLRSTWDDAIRRHLAERGVILHPPRIAFRRFGERLTRGGTVVLHLDGTPSPSHRRNRGREADRSVFSRRRDAAPASVAAPPATPAPSPTVAPLGVRAASRLISATNPRVFGVVSRRTAPNSYTLYVEDLTGAREGTLLDYLRRQVRVDPSDWLIFRAEHLGGGVRS